MRADAIFKDNFRFEYWTITAVGTTNQYSLNKELAGVFATAGPSSMYLTTAEQMAIPMQVRNLRDAAGTVVNEVGGVQYPLYIHSAEPQLDPFGNVVSWKHSLRRDPPRDFDALIQAALQNA